MSSMPHSFNITATVARRNPFAPDLWIPYVLIGASCVTFLAVHFWCYHKRNRERYLRQREEKRLKIGLMERRRITTLVLARYQSDLGVKQSDTDIDLKQLYKDNYVDAPGDDKNNDGASTHHNLQRLADKPSGDNPTSTAPNTDIAPGTSTALNTNIAPGASTALNTNIAPGASTALNTNIAIGASTAPNTNIAHGASIDHDYSHVSRTLSNTWPLVSECKFMPYNAHTRRGDDTCQVHIETVRKPMNKTYPNFPVNYSRMLSFQENNQTANRGRLNPQDLPNTTITTGDNEHNPAHKQSSPGKILHTSSSSISGSSVFYTNVSSSYSPSYSPIKPPFKRKNSKRRYDGVPVEINEPIRRHQHSSTYLPLTQWTRGASHPNRTSGSSEESEMLVYEDGINKCITDKSATSSSKFIVKGVETLSTSDFDEFDRSPHDKVTANTPSKGDLRNNDSDKLLSSRSDINKQFSERSSTQFEDRSRSNQDAYGACLETNIDMEIEAPATDIPASARPQNYTSDWKNRLLPERFCRNPSATSGKIRSPTIFKEDSTQAGMSDLHSITKETPDSSVSASISTTPSPNNDGGSLDLQSTATIEDQTPRLGRCSISQGGSNTLGDREAKDVHRDTLKESDRSAKKTPQLRGLDTKLVFQHRKRDTQSD